MGLPKFRSSRRKGQAEREDNAVSPISPVSPVGSEKRNSTEGTAANSPSPAAYVPGVNVKRATKTRKRAILLSCFFFFVSVIFLLLVSNFLSYERSRF